MGACHYLSLIVEDAKMTNSKAKRESKPQKFISKKNFKWELLKKIIKWENKSNYKVRIWSLLTKNSARTKDKSAKLKSGKVQDNCLEINIFARDLFLCYCQSKVKQLDS